MSLSATQLDSTAPDFGAIKTKQRATWGAGDYARIGVTLQITGEQLCEAMDLRAGQSVLDVAAGNGNVSLAAARRFCEVTASDYVQELLDQAEERARAEGLSLDLHAADAESLPFENDRFDNVVSTFGVMFAPDQTRAAAELIRVCRPGGTIGLANWTPDSFIGELFKTIGAHVPPPAGVRSPALWGTAEFINAHFGGAAREVRIESRQFVFRYRSPQHWLAVFGTYYGPTLKALEAAPDSAALRADILALIARHNLADDGTMVVPSEYLEVVVRR